MIFLCFPQTKPFEATLICSTKNCRNENNNFGERIALFRKKRLSEVLKLKKGLVDEKWA